MHGRHITVATLIHSGRFWRYLGYYSFPFTIEKATSLRFYESIIYGMYDIFDVIFYDIFYMSMR